jgi:hypothetical protein
MFRLLINEIEQKKILRSYKDIECDECGSPINEGDDFIFVASEKVCSSCKDEILDRLNDLYEGVK